MAARSTSKTRRKKLTGFLFTIALFYGGICLLAFLFQNQLIFFPIRELAIDPGEAGLDYEDLWLDANGKRIHAWFVPAADARATVIWCHGNAGNISHRLDTLMILHRMGLATLIFDYPGYGRSDGSPGESAITAAAEAAFRHVTETRGIGADRIVIWGRSLGGTVAVALAARHRPAALIVESSFPSVPAMGQAVYPWLPVKLLCRHGFDAEALVGTIDCPKLFLHSPEDDIVPFKLGKRLFAAAAEPKRFVETRGDHNTGFLESGPLYTESVREFLSGAIR